MERKETDCPTCNGWVWIPRLQKWIPTRETKGMVCQTCGKDYSKKD